MKDRINPETGKPECTITKPDQEAIAKVRNLMRRIGREKYAAFTYAVQGVTEADKDATGAAFAEKADDLLLAIGWPAESKKQA